MSDIDDDIADEADIVSAGARAKLIRRTVAGAGVVVALAAVFYTLVLPELKQRSAPPAPPASADEVIEEHNLGGTPVMLMPASPRADAEKFAPLIDRIAALEAKLATLEEAQAKQASVAMLEEKFNALQNRITAVENSPSSAANLQHIALLSTFTQLQKAVKQGAPFSGELAQLAALAGARPETLKLLSSLQPFSTRRSLTLTELNAQLARSIDAAESGGDKDSLSQNLRSLVRIRKEGKPDGNDDASIIARAESAMADDDVETAARELAALSATKAPHFSGWLNSAQQYLKLHAALDAVQLELAKPESPAVP